MLTGGDERVDPIEQELFMENQDELQIARVAQPAEPPSSTSPSSVRCVDGR